MGFRLIPIGGAGIETVSGVAERILLTFVTVYRCSQAHQLSRFPENTPKAQPKQCQTRYSCNIFHQSQKEARTCEKSNRYCRSQSRNVPYRMSIPTYRRYSTSRNLLHVKPYDLVVHDKYKSHISVRQLGDGPWDIKRMVTRANLRLHANANARPLPLGAFLFLLTILLRVHINSLR